MKNLFAALLALIFLFAFHAPAEDAWDRGNTPRTPAEISGDWEYIVLPDGTAEITKYNGGAETLDIPSELDGHAVTRIGDGAFYYCSGLTSVTIPDSVKEIGANPFEACMNLTAIKVSPEHEYLAVIDGALISKPDMRLVWCPMNKQGVYAIPQGVREIGDNAFSGCDSLTSVTIPDGVTSIGDGAFESCSGLTSVIIPEGVTSIGGWAFYWCGSLTSVTIPNSVTFIGDEAFFWCPSLTSVTIPEGMTSIGDEAFSWCLSLTSVTIPSSVTFIGDRAFAWCADELTLTVQKDSCAEEYCRDNDLKYICPETSDR